MYSLTVEQYIMETNTSACVGGDQRKLQKGHSKFSRVKRKSSPSQERRRVGDKLLRPECEWAIHEMKGSLDT